MIALNASSQEVMLNPTGTVLDLKSELSVFRCPEFNIDAMRNEDSINAQNGVSPARIAKKFDVNISTTNFGSWEKIDSYNVWRCKLTSEDAFSMMTIFEGINLPENASIFIYNEDMSHVVGPITQSVNQYSVYPSEFIPGSTIIVELVVVGNIQTTRPYFTITGISHDYYDFYRNVFYKDNNDFAEDIEACINKDINCSLGSDWQTHKRSVALIVYNGAYLCSGSLINNTNFDGKALYLTANHCISSNTMANSCVFYFNHESKSCGRKKDNGNNYIVSGSTLKSNNNYSDFALLELHGRAPSSYYPYFSGWDKSGVNPLKGVGIHHPKGNLKKIALENNSFSSNAAHSDYGVHGMFAPLTLWQVNFDEGGVINGSSGSPLFNQNKKIIGQLLGGYNGCNALKEYGRLSVSWDYSSNITKQLRHWLDPLNTNPDEIPGLLAEGWRHQFLQPGFDARKVHSGLSNTVAVGQGNQVYYRSVNDEVHYYYYDGSAWQHVKLDPIVSNLRKVSGDITVGIGNQVFYRGGNNGELQTIYWNGSTWAHAYISVAAPSADPYTIALGSGNGVFFSNASDRKMKKAYIWNNNWTVSDVSTSTFQNIHKVKGDVLVGSGDQLFYKGDDNKVQSYYWAQNNYEHVWLGGQNANADFNVNNYPGSMAIDKITNRIFYRGADNKVHMYAWSLANGWQHSWLGGQYAPYEHNAFGKITVAENATQVIYRGMDGKMHMYWYDFSNNAWVHDWIESSWQAPTAHSVSGSISYGVTDGVVFYRGTDGFMKRYFWENGALLKGEDPNEGYFGMDKVALSPTIPTTQKNNLAFSINPNPANNYATLQFKDKDAGELSITVINSQGVVVKELKENLNFSSAFDIDISALPTGIYFVSVQSKTKGKIGSQKLIKQ